MADIENIQKKRNTLYLTPKRNLTSIVSSPDDKSSIPPTTVTPSGGSTPTQPVTQPITSVVAPTTPAKTITSTGSGTAAMVPIKTDTATPQTNTSTGSKLANAATDAASAAIAGSLVNAGVKKVVGALTPVKKPTTTTPTKPTAPKTPTTPTGGLPTTTTPAGVPPPYHDPVYEAPAEPTKVTGDLAPVTKEDGTQSGMFVDQAGNYWQQDNAGNYTLVDAFGNPIGNTVDSSQAWETNYPVEQPTDTFQPYEATDDAGNVWMVNPDGSFDLIKDANQPADTTGTTGSTGEITPADPTYPPYENPTDLQGPYPPYENPSDYQTPPPDSPPSWESDFPAEKKGGLIHMKNGGLPKYAEGSTVMATPDYTSYTDPNMDISNPAYGVDPNPPLQDLTVNDPVENTDVPTVDATTDTTSSNINSGELQAGETAMQDEAGNEWAVDANGNYRLIRAYDATDPANDSTATGTNTGSGSAVVNPQTPIVGSEMNGTTPTNGGALATQTPTATPAATPSVLSQMSDKLTSFLSDPNVQKAGLTAGMLATLMALSKNSGSSYKAPSVTMPSIGPRTTDFGIGPARVVTPPQGGLQSMTPQQQTDLYTNLGVPGYEVQHEAPSAPSAPTGGLGLNPNPPLEQQQPPQMADGGLSQSTAQKPNPSDSYYTYGKPQDPMEILGIRQRNMMSDGGGGQTMNTGGLPDPVSGVPLFQGRHDYRQGAAVTGAGDGQSDDIPAMLADGEYVFDADVVAALGNGSNKAGAEVLDRFRENIRAHKRSAHIGKIPPKAKSPLAYLKEAQK